MHCWKTINVKKQYGFDRIFLLSSLIGLAAFSFGYVLLNLIAGSAKSDAYFAFFVMTFLLIYPMHKALHFIPLVRFRKRIKLCTSKQFGFLPIFSLRIREPIPKSRFLIALLLPFIVLNISFLIGAVLFPAFGHYFTILLAFHTGLCFIDLLYVKHMLKSPKQALIEENESGYEILVPPTA